MRLVRIPSERESLPELRAWQWFALIFTAIFLLHAPLLRLPYYWDEAGYYIPAAWDLFTRGTLIPQSVPSNAHPPLLSIWLAAWWKLSAFKPSVTRIAMLLVAAFGLTAVFRLSRYLTNASVAAATIVCSALFPIWFAQSSLAHADLPAAAFTLWALFFYFRSLLGRRYDWRATKPALILDEQARIESTESRKDTICAALLFVLATLSKETAVLFPLMLAAYELISAISRRAREFLRPALLIAGCVPLACWFAYHRARTGFFFGNPEFFAYNVSGTLTPLRAVLSLAQRTWQLLGYMNMWLVTAATIWAMMYPPMQEEDGSERPRIAFAAQYRIAALLAANIVFFSLIGGAVLARYMLPAYPLALLIAMSTVRRRVKDWHWLAALTGIGFVLALFVAPFGYIPPEDNLSYRDYVLLHKDAADYLSAHKRDARVLTAWTATDELTKQFLGYVKKPLHVVRIENFALPQLELARAAESQFDVALLFSTKQQPANSLLDRWPLWERLSRRYFDFHRDLPPEAAAELLGGHVTWERRMGRQWIAIVSFDRVEYALAQHESFNHEQMLQRPSESDRP